jgi:hypothetical protein
MKKLTGTLVYVCLNKPVKAYVASGEDAKPDEWKAGVVLTDEDVVDEYESFAKSLGAKVSAKKVKASEFKDKYKCELPEGAGKNVWVVTLRKSTQLGRTGKEVPDQYKPKVFEKVKSTLVDITNTKLPANGSKGSISLDIFERTNGTASIYLKNVLVTDLIEYVPEEGSGYHAGDEFSDEVDAPKAEKAEKAEAKPAKEKAKAKPAADEDDDDIPF